MRDNRVALVTGAGRSIGAATAALLARRGYRVALADLSLAAARRQAALLDGGGHLPIEMDVMDETSITDGFDLVEKDLGPIKALVSVVGGPITTEASGEGMANLAVEDWDATYRLNTRSQFIVLREMLRRRTAHPVADARCVTISSIGGEVAWNPTGVHYVSSKAAVIALTKFAAVEAARLGMTVNTVAPGAIDGPNFRASLGEETIRRLIDATPIQRLGTPEELASTIAWLLSDEAGYITGATIDVNGGRRMA